MNSLNSSLYGYGLDNGAIRDILQIWQCRYRQFIVTGLTKEFTTLYVMQIHMTFWRVLLHNGFCISCKIHLAPLDGFKNKPMGSRRVRDNDIMIDHIISLLFHRILVTRDFLGMSRDVVRSLNCVSCSSLVKQQFLGAFMTSSSDILLPLQLLTSDTEFALSQTHFNSIMVACRSRNRLSNLMSSFLRITCKETNTLNCSIPQVSM